MGHKGSALALKTWACQQRSETLQSVNRYTDGKGYYENETELIEQLKDEVAEAVEIAGRYPSVLVMGALGRCGRGAVDLFKKVGFPEENIIRWDLAETAEKPGPYMEIVEADIFVNAIYLSKPIPPFINAQVLASPSRKLSVICDVSCDTTNPHNPIPVYSINTTFTDPTVPVPVSSGPLLDVISIDHLPSLLPRESSEAFGQDLLPYLKQLNNWRKAEVWERAEKLFQEKVALLPDEFRTK
jgi:saccharopine dehydrogenase (NAD+, L-lysine-forming)